MTTTEIQQFSIQREEGNSSFLEFAQHAEFNVTGRDFGGEDHGMVVIRFRVDEIFDQISISSNSARHRLDWQTLDRAIAILAEARGALDAMHGFSMPTGKCQELGDWGQCRDSLDHDGECSFPSRESSVSP